MANVCLFSCFHSSPIYLYFPFLLLLLSFSSSLVTFSDSPVLSSNVTCLSLAVQPLWRFTDSPADGRLLVYRSEDIKNLSRIVSPKVCGYIHAEASDLLPQTARRDWEKHEEVDKEKGELCCLFPSLVVESLANVCGHICSVNV